MYKLQVVLLSLALNYTLRHADMLGSGGTILRIPNLGTILCSRHVWNGSETQKNAI